MLTMMVLPDSNPGEGQPINVLLCLEPRLIRQMTRKALSSIPDIRIVGDCQAPGRIQQAVDEQKVDWVIFDMPGDDQPLLAEPFDFLVRNPKVSLLAIAIDGAKLKTWWLSLHEKIIQSPTLEDIVEVLHSGIRSTPHLEKA